MESWITFWTVAFIVIVVAYYLIAIVLLPLGIRDLFALFSQLNKDDVNQADQAECER